MKKRKLRRGFTLVEALVSSVVTVMTLGTAASVYIASMGSWYQGTGKITAEMQSRQAMKLICAELAESMDVVIDADGMGITFHKPGKDDNGDFRTDVNGQPESDGINRRIYLNQGKIKYSDGVGNRVLATNVITTDPLSTGGTAPYKIFVAGGGAITRQVTVMIATATTGKKAELVKARKREIVFLRNIYDTTR